MRYLGKSGLKVSCLCLGTMSFGSVGRFKEIGKVDLKESTELIQIALENGINFFDTSDAYSRGVSEEILGKGLGSKRKDNIICTKVRFKVGDNPNDEGNSRYHIINACNASLRRLGTDYIDIYMLHSMDLNTRLEATMRALDDLVRQGKVRYIGVSNFSAWMLMKSLAISEKQAIERFITYQGYYSVISRDLENEIIPLCLDQGLGVMVWSPLSGGFLTGKFKRDMQFPKGTRIGDRSKSDFIPPIDYENAFRALDKMEEIAANHGASIPQVALNYLLEKPAVSSLIVGTRKKEQLLDNLKAINWKLTKTELLELDEASARPKPYPYWHHDQTGINN